MSQAELAAYVQTELRKDGIDAVLTGGSVVAIYSSGKYVSMDIDLVDLGFASAKQIRATMARLGFTRRGRYFAHPKSKYIVDFVAGPISVGSQPIEKFRRIRTSAGILKIITPTDCVKDRLAAYFHWNDAPSLEQAVLVAKANRINLAEIKRWSARERKTEYYKVFRNELRTKR